MLKLQNQEGFVQIISRRESLGREHWVGQTYSELVNIWQESIEHSECNYPFTRLY